MQHWLSHFFGLDNPSGPFYLAWSGVLSDLSELSLPVGLVLALRHANCHVKGCWRFGRHPHGPFKVCSKHHPDIPDRVTQAVVEAHRRVP